MSDTSTSAPTTAVPEPMLHVRANADAVSPAAEHPSVKPALEVLESSIVQYAIETKLRTVMSSYMKTAVLPVAALTVAVAGYMGFKLDAKLNELRAAQTQVEQLQRDTAQQQGELRVVSDRLALITGNVTSLDKTLGLTARDLNYVSNESRKLQTTADNQQNKLASNGEKVVALATEAVGVRTQHEANKKQLADLESQTVRLKTELADAEANALRLQQITDFQARLLTSNVVEIVSLNSDDKSGEIKLPRRGGSDFILIFSTPTIKNSFTLTYFVNGQQHTIPVGNEMRGQWIPLADTEGQYEFTLDNLYYSRAARNFITIRIRGTERLLGSNDVS